MIGKYFLKKKQLTRDLKDKTIIIQGIKLPCKIDQGYCDPTKRTQATIVWFPEDSCTTFQVPKLHARMIKFHEKYFIESIPFENVNPIQKRQYNTQHLIQKYQHYRNKLTHFQIYHETDFPCKHKNPLYKTQYSEILLNTTKVLI